MLISKKAQVVLDFLELLREDHLESHVKKTFCSLQLNKDEKHKFRNNFSLKSGFSCCCACVCARTCVNIAMNAVS